MNEPLDSNVRAVQDGRDHYSDLEMPDEQHIAQAVYMLQKAIATRANTPTVWPIMHQCLRDAAIHCEEARKFWTKEKEIEMHETRKLLGL